MQWCSLGMRLCVPIEQSNPFTGSHRRRQTLIRLSGCSFASGRLQRNPFVETALGYALTYVSALTRSLIQPATITVLADNDYYSRPSPNLPRGAPASHGFNKFGVHLWDAHKTGLGSSAALVTAFVGAVLVHYLPEDKFSLTTDSGKARLHNLAQAAHCAAQGKVGSGFDVASAVYGSCLYRRFSPALLESHGEPGSAGFAERLRALVEETDEASRWDTQITKSAVTVPKGVRLVMCDVDCGSQTPGMVTKVLAWRREKPEEANRVWSQLQRRNEALAAELVELAANGTEDYNRLKRCISDIRAGVREMSRLSGVPIEPEPQTQLLDACTDLAGVIGGVVPGAGGYDAVALLVEDEQQVLARLRTFLGGWRFEGGGDPDAKPGKVSVLGVREETEGVRPEDGSMYDEWVG